MKKEVFIKIMNDPKLHSYLINNSYWYKYLNRSDKYYKDFISEFKANSRLEKTKKVNDAINTLDTVNSIFKMLK